MVTAILILAAIVLVLGLIGVCCQIAGGGFWGLFHVFNDSLGVLLEALGSILGSLFSGE